MHSAETVNRVLELRAQGLGARRISRLTGVSVRTVSDWIAGKLPRAQRLAGGCPECGRPEHRLDELDPEAYSYLLGMYLGDGYLAPHPRGVWRLRISLDRRYPGIVEMCERAIPLVLPGAKVARQQRTGSWGEWVEIGSYSRAWPCLFPHGGPGLKHTRAIELRDWQVALVKRAPEAFLRGLIHSDGCRFENTGRDGWRNPRYSFSNKSDDIIALFCWACEMLELHWTEAGDTIYVSRKADVARMDEFIGPKR
jgi:hypothetical protein